MGEYSNLYPTLMALDAFRFSKYLNNKAVEFLLDHWTIRKPIGPCRYGIGTLFMQVKYPWAKAKYSKLMVVMNNIQGHAFLFEK